MSKHQKNLNGWNYATMTIPIKYRDHLSAWEAKLEITRTLDSRLPAIVIALAGAGIEREMIEEPEKPKDPNAHLGGTDA